MCNYYYTFNSAAAVIITLYVLLNACEIILPVNEIYDSLSFRIDNLVDAIHYERIRRSNLLFINYYISISVARYAIEINTYII